MFSCIERDGMLAGPDLAALRAACEAVGPGDEIVYSGGVASVEDLVALRAAELPPLRGVIVGTALFEGRLTSARARPRSRRSTPDSLAARCTTSGSSRAWTSTAGRVVKGTGFVDLRDAGDPVELAARYDAAGADELVLLDITATSDTRETVVELARRVADELFIPFTIGGGIRSVADAQAVLDAGADKVSVNSAALRAAPSCWTSWRPGSVRNAWCSPSTPRSGRARDRLGGVPGGRPNRDRT